MPITPEVLKRLHALYDAAERHAAIVLQKRTSEVMRAKVAVDRETVRVRSSAVELQRAVAYEDRLDAAVATVRLDAAVARRGALEKILSECEEQRDRARDSHRTQNVKHEQVRRLLADARARLAVDADRREQMLADERFLQRKGASARRHPRDLSP